MIRVPLARLTRAQLWWSSKLLPVAGLGALGALTAQVEPGRGLVLLVATLVSAIGLAGASHLVNDWSDVAADAAAGRPNVLEPVSTGGRFALVALTTALGGAPWFVVGIDLLPAAVLVALAVLTVAYSAPPLRLKGRGLAGVLADAANAHVLPAAFVLLLMGEAGVQTGWWSLATTAALIWASGFGVRSIVVHQRIDRDADRAAGVSTFVATHRDRAVRDVGLAAFRVELVGLVGLGIVLAGTAPLVVALLAAYLALWVGHRRFGATPLDPLPRHPDGWMPLAEFYEVWPALLLALQLCLVDLGWWPLPVALVILFAGAVAKQASDLGVMLGALGRDVARSFEAHVARPTRAALLRFRGWWFDGWPSRSWYHGGMARVRYWPGQAARRQGRRFRRIVLRRAPSAPARGGRRDDP
ncbi:MAG: UbiA family prenyltransferase [Iamia sp.]